MLLAVHLDDARARYPHHQHVRLLVDVLADAPSRREPHEVGVEIAAPLQGPNHPRASSGSGQASVEVRYVGLRHPNEILAHVPAENAGVLSPRLSNTGPPVYVFPFRSRDRSRFERARTGRGATGRRARCRGLGGL